MDKKDLKNLVFLWVLGILAAALTALVAYKSTELFGQTGIPTASSPTRSWFLNPATTISQAVHGNFAWTILIIFPFLFAPIFTLLYAIRRYSSERQKVAEQFHENVHLEIFWTVVPALVLVLMALPAYSVLRKIDKAEETPKHVIEVLGVQFYWQYHFPEYDVTVTDDGTGTDPLYIPVNQMIQLDGRSEQVNHAWWVPAFGVKFDVIPGRITRGLLKPTQEGFFKGQCAELCGALHGYMWIHVKVVSEKEFYEWIVKKGGKIPEDQQAKVAALLGTEASSPAVAMAK